VLRERQRAGLIFRWRNGVPIAPVDPRLSQVVRSTPLGVPCSELQEAAYNAPRPGLRMMHDAAASSLFPAKRLRTGTPGRPPVPRLHGTPPVYPSGGGQFCLPSGQPYFWCISGRSRSIDSFKLLDLETRRVSMSTAERILPPSGSLVGKRKEPESIPRSRAKAQPRRMQRRSLRRAT
jgi:hypothetical protein